MSDIGTTRLTAPRRNLAIKAAAILYLVFGLGTLVSYVPIIFYMVQKRAFPVVLGIPLLGSTFADRLGLDFMIIASLIFEIVNTLEVLAGYWLWKSDKRGGRLAVTLLPVGVLFWI